MRMFFRFNETTHQNSLTVLIDFYAALENVRKYPILPSQPSHMETLFMRKDVKREYSIKIIFISFDLSIEYFRRFFCF